MAEDLELDLVEISPKADTQVCKIIDYKKFLYEQKKRDKVLKAKATKVVVKEIRFGPQTDDHDYEFKKRHAEKFLKEGAKLKAFVFFKAIHHIIKLVATGGLLPVSKQHGSIVGPCGIKARC